MTHGHPAHRGRKIFTLTAETDISPLLECAARLETITNTKHWYGVIVVPHSEMPYDLTLIEAGAIAFSDQHPGTKQTGGENMIVRLCRVLQCPKCGSIYCNGGCD